MQTLNMWMIRRSTSWFYNYCNKCGYYFCSLLWMIPDFYDFCICIQSIAVGELISRAAKHLFKTYMQAVDTMSLSSAVSHFLNCYLGSYAAPHAQLTAEEVYDYSWSEKFNTIEGFCFQKEC